LHIEKVTNVPSQCRDFVPPHPPPPHHAITLPKTIIKATIITTILLYSRLVLLAAEAKLSTFIKFISF